MNFNIRIHGGLGNYMRVLASCLALKKQFNAEITVIWERTAALNASFGDLFEELEGISIREFKYVPRWNRFARRRRALKISRIRASCSIWLDDKEIRQLRNLGTKPEHIFNNKTSAFIYTCEPVVESERFITALKPVPEILRMVDERMQKWEGRAVTGLHIRRGDNLKSIGVSKTNYFIDEVWQELHNDPNRLFYLSTDSPEEAEILLKTFPDKLFFDSSDLRRNHPLGIKQALVDLICLSRTERIIGSYWSSFSEVAASYGQIPLKIAGL